MKTKKYVLAIAIFGGVLFTVQAFDKIINLDDQQTTLIDKRIVKINSNG